MTGTPGGLMMREFDGRALLRAAARRPVALLVGLGMALRLAEYLRDRPLWLDEDSLRGNLVGVSPWAGPAVMTSAQLAPYGFVVVERAIAAVAGGSPYALRLLPLAGSLASVPLFAVVARRCLRPRARLVGLGLFALSDPLIYYAAELKPYAVDVAAALAAWAMAIGLRRGRRTGARLLVAAALGAALVWFSFPVAFVLAGVGLVAIAGALAHRRRAEALALAAVGAGWLASFAASQAVARRLVERGPMLAFWDFALPPRSLAAVEWLAASIVNLFANPMHFDTPLGPAASALLGALLALVGIVAMGGRRPGWLARLALPPALTLLAAAARSYPFHGRLLLFLLPALYLWVAEGIARVGAAIGRRWAYRALLVAVFAWPVAAAVLRLVEPPVRSFTTAGDLRPNPFLDFDDPPPSPGPAARTGTER